MSDRPTQAGFHKLSCPCGADIRVDARSSKRSETCPKCHLTLDFVVSMDPKTRKPRVALVMSAGSFKPPPAPEKPKTAKTRTVRRPLDLAPQDKVGAPCSCGAILEIEADALAENKTCGSCGTEYHMIVKLDRETRLKTAILVPKGPLTGRKQRPDAPPRTIARAAPRPRASRLRLPAILARTPNTPLPPIENARSRYLGGPQPGAPPAPAPRTPAPPAPKPPPEIPIGAQRAQCACGEYFIVRRRDVGHEQDCPGCAKRITFIETRDPQTLSPIISVRPAGVSPPT